ncbi:MAG: MFS transporter [Planctomycetota bacterium]|jgi:GPH family glycoside/pentoside/hexuronide:cation symporter
MVNIAEDNKLSCSTFSMVKYGLGQCVDSLVLNSFFGYSMLYYTKALGLAPEMAGIATFIATLWDAISDPIMGHISDNTKSRFGKRHPYMLFGGIAMIASFFFIWYVPDFFKTDLAIGSINISAMTLLFGYLVAMNLILRTSYTVFIVPYTALGFEICDDYHGRSKLQGIGRGLNMAANLLGPALAWSIFFNNNDGDIKATQIARNYINMGTVFTVASFILLFLMLYFTAKYMKDSRGDKTCHSNPALFFKDMKEIILDKYSRWVFIFIFFVLLGVVLVSTLQMYVFDDFMKLDGFQKTITHGGTMVGMGLGALSLAFFVRRFDKKGAIYVGVSWSVFCELVLAALFLTGFIKPGQVIGGSIVPAGTIIDGVATTAETVTGGLPIAFMLFAFFHGAYWFGNGILLPIAISMMADVSEIHKIHTGVNKDASYAAMFSFAMKTSISVAGLVAGYCLLWTGFKSGSDAVQTPESIWRVCALTFVVGPVASLAALGLISKYPVTKTIIEEMRDKFAEEEVER